MLEFYLIKIIQTCNFLKKRLQDRCFPAKFAKFWRTSILKNIYEWLLLKIGKIVVLENVLYPKSLIHFRPMFPFYTPWKCQKSPSFLMFSGSIGREYWLNMDSLRMTSVISSSFVKTWRYQIQIFFWKVRCNISPWIFQTIHSKKVNYPLKKGCKCLVDPFHATCLFL